MEIEAGGVDISIGLGLLQKIMEENRPLSFLQDHNLGEEAFEGDEKSVYTFLSQHVRRHGRMPKAETVEQETDVSFRDFPDEPLGYWLDNLIARNQSNLILETYRAVKEDIVSGDVNSALRRVKSLALDVDRHNPSSEIVTLADSSSKIIEDHDKRQRSTLMGGVPFGIEYLDNISDGAQPSDTVAFVGRPGVGKSYFLGKMSLYSYREMQAVPLVVTMEMSAVQWSRRLAALESSVTAQMLRLGRLSIYGKNQLQQAINIFAGMDRPYYILQGSLNSTVEDLALRVQELRPSVVYVDGAYLMQTKEKNKARWERVTTVAEYQKMIAKEFDIPIIASWQFNRKGPGSLGNIAYSDAISQLASIVCGIEDEKKQGQTMWEARVYKILKLLKGREGERGVIRVLYDMDRMVIEQDSVISGYSIEKEEEDVDGD